MKEKEELTQEEIMIPDETPKNVIDILLDRLDNASETSELGPNTRAILMILHDLGFSSNDTMPKTVKTSIFDEFNNQVLRDTMGSIRSDCVRMESRYAYVLDRVAQIKPSMRASGPVSFI